MTGLCAARRLEELGYTNYVVLEKSAHAGGLARYTGARHLTLCCGNGARARVCCDLEQRRCAHRLHCRSFRDEQGFFWDLGVHVLFSHFEFFDLLLDAAIPPK